MWLTDIPLLGERYKKILDDIHKDVQAGKVECCKLEQCYNKHHKKILIRMYGKRLRVDYYDNNISIHLVPDLFMRSKHDDYQLTYCYNDGNHYIITAAQTNEQRVSVSPVIGKHVYNILRCLNEYYIQLIPPVNLSKF